MNTDIKKVWVRLRSTVDGSETRSEYGGEYRRKSGAHHIVYTDYTGNTVTKNGIEATDAAMLLHRVGEFGGDMLFDPAAGTLFRYRAWMVQQDFLLRTYEYRLAESESGVIIFVRYGLSDGSGEEEIQAEQEIEIRFENGGNIQ